MSVFSCVAAHTETHRWPLPLISCRYTQDAHVHRTCSNNEPVLSLRVTFTWLLYNFIWTWEGAGVPERKCIPCGASMGIQRSVVVLKNRIKSINSVLLLFILFVWPTTVANCGITVFRRVRRAEPLLKMATICPVFGVFIWRLVLYGDGIRWYLSNHFFDAQTSYFER